MDELGNQQRYHWETSSDIIGNMAKKLSDAQPDALPEFPQGLRFGIPNFSILSACYGSAYTQWLTFVR